MRLQGSLMLLASHVVFYLLIKYLGVPTSTTKFKTRDCQDLVDKMTGRIRT